MAITYPLTLPTHTGIRSVSFRARNAVAYSMSPFTFAGQAHQYAGQMWEADITLPTMRRSNAEQWNAFLMSLNGQAGTFLLGDPNGCVPRGTALSFKKNLLTFTEQFDNAAWVKTRATVTTNAALSPDGNTTADSLDGTEVGSSYVYLGVTLTSGLNYTFSCYVKANTYYGDITLRDFTDVSGLNFNLTTLDVSSSGVSASNANATDEGNGWYRISVTFTPTAPTRSHNIGITIDTADSGIYVWGAQLEAGSVATEYQPIADGYGPFVNGAGQTGSELIIDGASPNEDGYLKAGDYIQLGTASSARLHKVLADVATDDDGNATIDIWPSLRSSPADNSTVIIENCKGRFRLAENVSGWNADVAQYGITFSAMEAV